MGLRSARTGTGRGGSKGGLGNMENNLSALKPSPKKESQYTEDMFNVWELPF
jgi:hypothetical protein